MTQCRRFSAISDDLIKKIVDRGNPESPLYKFIGNKDAVDFIVDIAFHALKTENRACPGINIALYGRASTGKTTLVKILAEILNLPLLVMQADEIINNDLLFSRIESVLDNDGLYLISETKNNRGYYELPPMIVFIDEVHSLNPLLRNSLLSVLDRETCTLSTTEAEILCKNVYFIAATTEKGRLPLPLESRFVPISINQYSAKEVSKIVNMRTGFPESVCDKISVLTRIPREAIAFAKQVSFLSERQVISLEEATIEVASRKGINDIGLDKKQLDVMIALARSESGRSMKQLCNVIGVNQPEMEAYVLPMLMLDTSDRQAFVSVSNRHYITEYGKQYLDIKGML